MKSLSGSPQYAGFFRRFVAYFIDGTLISLISIIFQTILGHNPAQTLQLLSNPEALAALRAQPSYTVAQVVAYLVSALYFILFWVAYEGATPGGRMVGIRVIRDGKAGISVPTAIVRLLGMIVSAIPFCLGYLWVIWDGKKQAWHDKIAQTYVVRTEKGAHPAIVVLIFLLAILYQGGMIATGAFAGYMAARSTIGKQAQNAKSITSFNASVENLPPDAKAHYDKSVELFKKMHESSNDRTLVIKLNDENISELKKALEIVPNNARIWFDLGSAYTWVSSKGTLEQGLEAFGKAEELDPKNVIYMTSVGDMLIRLGKYQDAVLELQKAIRLDPNYAQPEYLIGVAYSKLGITAEAKTHLNRSIEIWKKLNDNGQFDDEILQAQQSLAGIKE